MGSHIALWVAFVGLTMMAWAAWELGGERMRHSESGKPGAGWYRAFGLIFYAAAVFCARVA